MKKLGDLMKLPLRFDEFGEVVDADGGTPPESAELVEAVARALNCHDDLLAALKSIQFGWRRCPACVGWNVGPYGETDEVHTATCPVAAAIAKAEGRT